MVSAPSNPLVSALLTDLYQITMTYAHWKIGKHKESAIFELFFRKNPFQGEFTIFCGLDESLKHLESFHFSDSDIEYLKASPALQHCDAGYFEYLATLTTASLKLQALPEGTMAFPRIPLLILEGPLGLGQLLETTLLNLINFPSLLTTNAARMVLRAGPAPCIEFGLRRAQGPDGAMTASKYSYVGGFVATSNVQAGKVFGVPIAGTHAHAYVQAFTTLDGIAGLELLDKKSGTKKPFLAQVLLYRAASTNDGELAAFCAYACAFPDACLCLVDTYDTLTSGLLNFLAVAKALDDFGYVPKGVRLDSGDLACLSLGCREAFDEAAKERPNLANMSIVVSNDINEKTLQKLTTTAHAITTYGIGTNLVTCQAQPALGCVYKLVEWEGQPRIKLSQDMPKVTIPGRKVVYRLYGKPRVEGGPMAPLGDYMTTADEEKPKDGTPLVGRHPFQSQHRVKITPTSVVQLHRDYITNGKLETPLPKLADTRAYVKDQLTQFEATDVTKPQGESSKYELFVSPKLFRFLHDLWEKEAPMEERS